ncbi:MAG TPA: trans-aconitate methyltransferase [Octadecabacter sp.]|nr:trans-aconitate methyltransferase [Octadecabacter sp.]
MVADGSKDWDPESYASFRSLRLRPALDLLAQVGTLPSGDVIDLGCGDGAVGPALRERWPKFQGVKLIGVDSSASMLAKAKDLATDCGNHLYDSVTQADAALWSPHAPPALIFSNACLHWLPDHPQLIPRLFSTLAPNGVLAVQMPRQYDAPSHALLRTTAVQLFPDLFDFTEWVAPVAPPQSYTEMLAPLGQASVWETDYIQTLPAADGHPVRHFTQSTAMRPFMEKLDAAQSGAFVEAYEAALDVAYPRQPDGSVLFAFKRLFFVLRKS